MSYTLTQLKTRAWWAIDDDATTPQRIDTTTLGSLINDALEDLGPHLNIIKSATLSFSDGLASVASDFIEPVALYDGTTRLDEIKYIPDKVEDTNAASQWMLLNNSQVRLFGKTPAGTVTFWYKAYPTALSGASDTPSQVPARFQRFIPEVYCKAQWHFKKGQLNEYAGLMQIWEQVKAEVDTATSYRRQAEAHQVRQEWD